MKSHSCMSNLSVHLRHHGQTNIVFQHKMDLCLQWVHNSFDALLRYWGYIKTNRLLSLHWSLYVESFRLLLRSLMGLKLKMRNRAVLRAMSKFSVVNVGEVNSTI